MKFLDNDFPSSNLLLLSMPPTKINLLVASENLQFSRQYKRMYYHIELYTDFKDLAVEAKLEEALDAASIFYNKSETWIESEKLYEVLYQFELEVNNNGE